MAKKEDFEFDDLQGIFRFAHGRLSDACFILLKVKDIDFAKQWLAGAPVSNAASSSPLPNTALQIAFSAVGLAACGVRNDVIAGFSDEFTSGMIESNRARRLGDTGTNAPEYWQWGGNKEDMPDILISLYALPGELLAWEQKVFNEAYELGFRVCQRIASNGNVTKEAFGFADGISQPKMDWHREQSTNIHHRRSYSNLLAPGEIILGYPNEYGEYTDRPLLSEDLDENAKQLPVAEDNPQLKDLARNGGYLVFRQLQQDVPGFWKFVDQQSENNAERREQLAEVMVGRKRNGNPLITESAYFIPGIDENLLHKNNFSYDADPQGTVCPVGAHIRRSNPRTGDMPPGHTGFFKRLMQIFGFDRVSREQDLVASTRFHRILRRGRAYGSMLTPDEALSYDQDYEPSGLNFIALSANIARQFEFIQGAWIANTKFGGLQDETDPLLGNRDPLNGGTPTDAFSMPQASGPCQRVEGLPQFITVRGGGYFFMPGLRALNYIIRAGSPYQSQE